MNPWVIFTILASLTGLANGVSIVKLTVPQVVEAGTGPIILDCQYLVDEWERPGLVVKWYVDAVHLVYQWIPPIKPQALNVLSGRVNTSFKASPEPWDAYRAIYIQNPDPELTGRYSCTVSTFEDEDTRSADLLVWAAAQNVEIKFWRPNEHLVNITCLASAAAPEPSFSLFTLLPNGTRYEIEQRGESKTNDSGLWWVEVWGLVAWEDTPQDSKIACTVILPNTTYSSTHTKKYESDLPIITTTTTTALPTTAISLARDHHGRWVNVSLTPPGYFEISGLLGTANGCSHLKSTTWLSTLSFVTLLLVPWKGAADS